VGIIIIIIISGGVIVVVVVLLVVAKLWIRDGRSLRQSQTLRFLLLVKTF
jgi:hypothetical protein